MECFSFNNKQLRVLQEAADIFNLSLQDLVHRAQRQNYHGASSAGTDQTFEDFGLSTTTKTAYSNEEALQSTGPMQEFPQSEIYPNELEDSLDYWSDTSNSFAWRNQFAQSSDYAGAVPSSSAGTQFADLLQSKSGCGLDYPVTIPSINSGMELTDFTRVKYSSSSVEASISPSLQLNSSLLEESFRSAPFGGDPSAEDAQLKNRKRKADLTLSGMVMGNESAKEPPRQNAVDCLSFLKTQKRNGKSARKRFKNQEERLATSRTRHIGACICCRKQRIRCLEDEDNPDGPCLTCLSSPGSPTLNLPCIRTKITEIPLSVQERQPPFRHTKRFKAYKIVDLQDWASQDVKFIAVTQGVGNLFYTLPVRKFNPVSGDALKRTWTTNGKKMSYLCANYAISDTTKAREVLSAFIDRSIETSIDFYIPKADELLYSTYTAALQVARSSTNNEDRDLLWYMLRLWVTIRMESRSERIIGSELLGMQPQTHDPEASNFGHVLLPPVLGAQINLIMNSAFVLPWSRMILRQLEERVFSNKLESFFATYLCMFLLLHSTALLTRAQRDWAQKHGYTTRYLYMDLTKQLHHGAKTLLTHFHLCNKGSVPFTLSWARSNNVDLAKLEPDQVKFMEKTATLVSEKEPSFETLREEKMFEHDYFFLAQLYQREWRPIETI